MSDFTMLARIERVPVLNGVSAKAIGVWSLLHHALDRRGRVALGGVDYRTVLMRRLPIVDTRSRQWFRAGLAELERAGAFVIDGDWFQLIGHAGIDTPESIQKGRKSKATKPHLTNTSRTPDEHLTNTCCAPVDHLRSVSIENHSESIAQNRVDKSREEPPIVPRGDGGGFELEAKPAEKPRRERRKPQLAGTSLLIADSIRSEAQKRGLVYPAIVPSPALAAIAKWLEAQCATAGINPSLGSAYLARGFFSAKYPSECGYPWGLFCKQYASYWPLGQIRALAADELAERRRELERKRREARNDLTLYEALGRELEALG